MDEDDSSLPPFVLSRRAFGQSVMVALAGAQLAGCADSPPEKIVPYVDRPAGVIPGRPSFYATTAPRGGYGIGLLARSREGRPVKLEGNAEHPGSLGGTSAVEQALLYELYDDGRLEGVEGPSGARGFSALKRALRAPGGGAGYAFWLEPTTSPVLGALLAKLREALPEAVVGFGPTTAATRLEASRRVFGAPLEALRRLEEAEIVVSVGAELLLEGPDALRYARTLGLRRAMSAAGPRLYAVETPLSLTGGYADVRLARSPSEVARFPAELLAALARRGLAVPEALRPALAPFKQQSLFLDALAADLMATPGRAALFVGEAQPLASQVVGLGLEALMGPEMRRLHPTPLLGVEGAGALIEALEAGSVHTLIVEGNPLLGEAPGGRWAAAIGRAAERVVLTSYPDETAALATWTVARAHFLERWGALRAADGTLGTTQPLIRPLRGGRTIESLLAHVVEDRRGERGRVLDALRAAGVSEFDAVLERGLVPETASASVAAEPDWGAVAEALGELAKLRSGGLELSLVRDARVGEGEHAGNAWLRELPDPMTKLSWENPALLGVETAAELGLEEGDVVRLSVGEASVELPVFVQPGQAEKSVVVWPGYGRAAGGELAAQGGFDVRALRAALAKGGAVSLEAVGRKHSLAIAQIQASQLGRDVARRRDVDSPPRPREPVPPSLHPNRAGVAHQWGMVVDLAACTGCGACVIACQAENNIPSVGRVQVALGRVMHWIRIDRYYETHAGETRVTMQPMACQHCEKAPCEYVCPTAATNHSSDGLNQMVYNRCVGTRFCSNNCPYKVRRFSFFDYNRETTPLETMRMNPEVTVRARGVMEKCSYCVQRLRAGERDAHRDGRRLRDGDVRTACQEACPSGAIAFGLISDRDSEVSRWRASERAYSALGELGVRPRTMYLERLDRGKREGKS